MDIGIIGLGLIGGSLAMDFQKLGHRVFGISRSQSTCDQAIQRGIVTQASIKYELMKMAEVVFICTPLNAMEATLVKLVPYLSNTAVVTDVGSVKQSVVQDLTPHWQNFVGGHPMAGKTEVGLKAAQTQLFQGKAYVITPTSTTPPASLEAVQALATSLGAKTYQCSALQHDRAVAWISHLPVMISSNLIQASLGETDPIIVELAQALASSGFRDTSRVGGGPPELGVMMARYNCSELLRSLIAYRERLDILIQQIDQKDWSNLEQNLVHTQQARPQFLD